MLKPNKVNSELPTNGAQNTSETQNMGTQSPSLRSFFSIQMDVANDINKSLSSSGCSLCRDQWKMILVIAIPLLSMIVLSSMSLKEAVDVKELTTESMESITIAEQYAELVKMVQRERGMSAMYLSSNTLQPNILAIARSNSDKLFEALPFPTAGLTIGDIEMKTKADLRNYIFEWRKNVTNRCNGTTVRKNLEVYTSINAALIRFVISMVELPKSTSLHSTMVAYISLLMWSDVIGIQRALGSTFFTNCNIEPGDKQWYLSLHGQASALKEISFSYHKTIATMDDEALERNNVYRDFMDNVYNVLLIKETSGFCDKRNTTELLEATQQWFENMTVFIDEVFKMRSNLSTIMSQKLDNILWEVSMSYTAYILLQTFSLLTSFVLSAWYFSCLGKLHSKILIYTDNLMLRTKELVKEKKLTEKLLYRMLPKEVAQTLKRTGRSPAARFDHTSVYFSDIVGFTIISSRSSPMQVVELLNQMYSFFDDCIDKYDVYKVETIGDAYMVASGVPTPNGNAHALQICKMAVDIRNGMRNFKIPHYPTKTAKIRIGIHSGHLVAGVVGRKMPRYCLFGDTVNTASRMESTGEAQKIQISECTNNILKEHLVEFITSERGIVEVKGKGRMRTYWLHDYTTRNGALKIAV